MPARASASSPVPAGLPFYRPMLASTGSLPVPDDSWAFEVKLDGQRALAYLPDDGGVRLFARSGREVTSAYPELLALREAVAGPAVLDGEIVALGRDGITSFERLQQRMGLVGDPGSAARMSAQVPVRFMVFDVLHTAGGPAVDLTYVRRRRLLEQLVSSGPAWSVPGSLVGHGADALAATRAQGMEGVVCKRLDSRYQPGVRSSSWIKIRNIRTRDVVVGGWLPGRGRLAGLPGALLVGVPTGGPNRALCYAGRVGTGWSVRERERLAVELRAASSDTSPFANPPRLPRVRWVRARLVGEVRFSTWTRAGLLRQPSWHRLRPDMDPAQVTAMGVEPGDPDGCGER